MISNILATENCEVPALEKHHNHVLHHSFTVYCFDFIWTIMSLIHATATNITIHLSSIQSNNTINIESVTMSLSADCYYCCCQIYSSAPLSLCLSQMIVILCIFQHYYHHVSHSWLSLSCSFLKTILKPIHCIAVNCCPSTKHKSWPLTF